MGRELGEKERAIRPQYRSEHEWRRERCTDASFQTALKFSGKFIKAADKFLSQSCPLVSQEGPALVPCCSQSVSCEQAADLENEGLGTNSVVDFRAWHLGPFTLDSWRYERDSLQLSLSHTEPHSG